MNPKVSIIMPVYNAETTVSRMVDSILAQTMTEWELLAIDDGSTDASGVILDRFAYMDKRIRVFHKKNEGVAMARQLGVDNAIGEYSIHADADDWIEPTMLEEMLVKITADNADLIITDYLENTSDGREFVKTQNPSSLSAVDLLADILNGVIFGALWNKMLRTELYKKNGKCFYLNMNYREDVLCLVKILQTNDLKISYLNKPYYHYCENLCSISRKITRDTFNGIVMMQEALKRLLSDSDSRFKAYKQNMPLSVFCIGFINNIYSNSEIRTEFNKVRHLAYKTKSFRWRLGFLMIDLGMHFVAHLFIRF